MHGHHHDTAVSRKAMGDVLARISRFAAGDRVVFTQLGDGTTVMRAKTRSILELKGLLKAAVKKRMVSVAAMNIGRA